VIGSKVKERLRNNFFIQSMIPQFADNLKTHKLDEFGIPPEAEEYNGLWGHRVWGDEGRFYSEVLPFFARHLVF